MKRWWQKIITVLISLMIVSPVSAIDRETLLFYGLNNIFWYDGTNQNCSSNYTPSGDKVMVMGDELLNNEVVKSQIAAKLPGVKLGKYEFYEEYGKEGQTLRTYQLIQDGKSLGAGGPDNYGVLTLIQRLKKEAELKPYLVIGVESVNAEEFRAVMDELGSGYNVVMVTRGKFDSEYSNVKVVEYKEDRLADEIYASVANLMQSTNNFSGKGNNKNYAGETVFSDAELVAIEANKSFYQKAAEQYNFPWQILAVVHSMETSLRRYNPENGQGVYQFADKEERDKYGPFPAGEISDEEFQRQTNAVAERLYNKYGLSGTDLSNDAEVKRLFFRYNGTAAVYKEKALKLGFTNEEAENGEGSPYVMNRADEKRDPMSPNMDEDWRGIYVGDHQYDASKTSTSFGAFVKYVAIGGSSNAYCYAEGNATLNTVALRLTEGKPYNYGDMTPSNAYKAAMQEVGTYESGGYYGASCDRFVATVVRYSGYDRNFPIGNTGTQLEYLSNHKDEWVEIQNTGDTSILKPGDILVFSVYPHGHIKMYVEFEDGSTGTADASYGERTGQRSQGVSMTQGSYVFRIFRASNGTK